MCVRTTNDLNHQVSKATDSQRANQGIQRISEQLLADLALKQQVSKGDRQADR
jgi:hypothetical protein